MFSPVALVLMAILMATSLARTQVECGPGTARKFVRIYGMEVPPYLVALRKPPCLLLQLSR